MRSGLLPEVDTSSRLRYVLRVDNGSQREHASFLAAASEPSGGRNGHVRAEAVAVEALLGRSVADLDAGWVGEYLSGATVLVTGAGGSVGTELCARLTRRGVHKLLLVDQAEAALVELARAVRHDLGFTKAEPVLLDVRSRTRTLEVFEQHRPDVVFHAAAYKSVPLLEAFPFEGVATNVLGTMSIVAASRRVGVGRFVLFSTDKAVEPTSVLGQTKAVAEWIVAVAGREAARGRYGSVRLGNVVDSAGSILPIFRRQIANGGPVTVTHPKATRYLMTVGEAAGLAIAAGGLADSDGVFWLDSGPPVCVLDLARRLTAAVSGDVAIDVVGLRAGERLHEHLFSNGDEIVATPCDHVWRSTARRVDPAWLERRLRMLERQVQHGSAAAVRATLADMHSAPEHKTTTQATTVGAG